MFKKIAIATLSAAALMGAASAQDKTVDIDGTLNQLTSKTALTQLYLLASWPKRAAILALSTMSTLMAWPTS